LEPLTHIDQKFEVIAVNDGYIEEASTRIREICIFYDCDDFIEIDLSDNYGAVW
jgi:hypothetical protein